MADDILSAREPPVPYPDANGHTASLSHGEGSDPRKSSIDEVNAGRRGMQQVHLAPREWQLRCIESFSCACICEEGKVSHGVCCGACRRTCSPCCGCIRERVFCKPPRHALGQSTAYYSRSEGIVVSTNMVAEQSILTASVTILLFSLMWVAIIAVTVILRLIVPEYKAPDDGDVFLE